MTSLLNTTPEATGTGLPTSSNEVSTNEVSGGQTSPTHDRPGVSRFFDAFRSLRDRIIKWRIHGNKRTALMIPATTESTAIASDKSETAPTPPPKAFMPTATATQDEVGREPSNTPLGQPRSDVSNSILAEEIESAITRSSSLGNRENRRAMRISWRSQHRSGDTYRSNADSFFSTPTSSPLSIWKDSTPPPRPQRMMSRGRPVAREIRWEKTPPLNTPSSGITCISTSDDNSSLSTPSPLARPKRASRFNRNRQRLDVLLDNQRENVSEQAHLREAIRRLDEFTESKPSPLKVSFHAIKAAEKQSKELRMQLDDVKMEGRRIGVAIARARMIDEDQHCGRGEGLWVNRVFT